MHQSDFSQNRSDRHQHQKKCFWRMHQSGVHFFFYIWSDIYWRKSFLRLSQSEIPLYSTFCDIYWEVGLLSLHRVGIHQFLSKSNWDWWLCILSMLKPEIIYIPWNHHTNRRSCFFALQKPYSCGIAFIRERYRCRGFHELCECGEGTKKAARFGRALKNPLK